MPFIVDSVRLILSNRMVKIHSIQYSTIHCSRNKDGEIETIDRNRKSGAKDGAKNGSEEAFVFIELDRHSDDASKESLLGAIEGVMSDVASMVNDYPKMLELKNKLGNLWGWLVLLSLQLEVG